MALTTKAASADIASGVLCLSFFFCIGIAIWQVVAHGQIGHNTSKIDEAVARIRSIEEKLVIQPADVLAEVKAAREEFRQTRFTAEDGERMRIRIDGIVRENNLKEPGQ